MKILLVSSFLPYPLYSGGHVRLYNLIKELSEKHEITLVCEMRKSQTESDVKSVEKLCKKVITVERKTQWSIGNIIKTAFSKKSFLVTGHTNQEMKQKIREELLYGSFDLIHVETFYVMQNLPITKIPIILIEHNIEHHVYRRFADKASIIVRPLLLLDIAKIKKEEEKCWRKAARLVAVSESDAKTMKGKGLDPVIVANGVDIEKFSFQPKTNHLESKTRKLLFMGDFKWLQNRDAVKFIIEEIWPHISSKFKVQSSNFEIKLWIVGRKISESVRKLASNPDIIFDEESSARPTEELFREAYILLAPIRIGGGTSYKILESMSCGTPVVTTPLSADAIEAEDNHNIMVGKDAQEVADKAIELLTNPKLYEKIAKNGRKLIEEKYTWGKIAKDLEAVYKSLA